MKHLPLIAIFFFVSVASFGMGFLAHQPKTVVVEASPVFGGLQEDLDAEKAKKLKIMTGYFKAMERLKDTPTVDLSQGTSEEWIQAYVNLANEMEIELNGNENLNQLSGHIRAELAQQSMLCNNPNSNAFDPKDNNVANPQ